MRAALGLLCLFLGPVRAYQPDPSVLTPPPMVTAGVGTAIEFNMSASSCSAPFDSERGCDWPSFRPWLSADPAYGSKGEGSWYLIQRVCKYWNLWEVLS